MLNYIKKNTFLFTFILTIIFLLGPFFLASFFSVPSADDYETARESIKRGYLTYQVDHWNEWNGRYVSTALQSFPPFMNFVVYSLISIMFFLMFLHATYLLVQKIFSALEKKYTLLVSISFLCLYIISIPITSNFYWLSGSATYFLPIILFIYLLNILYKIFYIQNDALKKDIFLSSILIILIIGTSETSLFLLDAFLFSLFVMYFVCRKKISKTLFLLGAISFIASLVVVLAPGNQVRGTRFSGGGNIMEAIIKSIGATLDFSFQWLFFNPFLAATFTLVFFLSIVYFKQYETKRLKIFNINLFKVFFLSVFYVFSGFFVPYYSFGSAGPDRTVSLIQFVFLLSMMYFVLVIASSFHQKFNYKLGTTFYQIILFFAKVFLFSYIFVIFATNTNVRNIYNDLLSGNLFSFYIENNDIRDFLKSENKKTIALPSPTIVPITNSFRGDENFIWMAKFYMKKYDDSIKNITLSDYKIINRNIDLIIENGLDYFVIYDEQSHSLVYSIKKEKLKKDIPYKLHVFPVEKNILYREERKQGYSNQSFGWDGSKSSIGGFKYHVVHLPDNWDVEKVVTGQDDDGTGVWEQQIDF